MTQVEIGLNSISQMLLFACVAQEFRWVCCHLVLLENLILGVDNVFKVGVGVSINALVLPDAFICRKIAISSLPKAEKERVAISKAPADLNSLNDSSILVA